MRPTRRSISVCVTTLTAMAVVIPAQTAEAAVARHSPTSALSEQRVLARRQAPQLGGDRDARRPPSKEALQAFGHRRPRARCNWKRCWWTQRIAIGYYLVVKFTWSGTWRVRKQLDAITSLSAAASILCSFLGRYGPACGAITWGSVKYYNVMTNRALRHRRCLVAVKRIAGIGVPFLLRTVRCAR
jgi:hypothetical protein